MSFQAASVEEETRFYIDVNWNSAAEGEIYLSQTLDPADGILLTEGFNAAQAIPAKLCAHRAAVSAAGQ